MAINYRCGGCGRRDCNNRYGCLSCLGGYDRCWPNYPYYEGPCPDRNGCYEPVKGGYGDGGGSALTPEKRGKYGVFTAMLPMAVAPNGIIPLVNTNCMNIAGDFAVNSGLITVE